MAYPDLWGLSPPMRPMGPAALWLAGENSLQLKGVIAVHVQEHRQSLDTPAVQAGPRSWHYHLKSHAKSCLSGLAYPATAGKAGCGRLSACLQGSFLGFEQSDDRHHSWLVYAGHALHGLNWSYNIYNMYASWSCSPCLQDRQSVKLDTQAQPRRRFDLAPIQLLLLRCEQGFLFFSY